MEAYVMDAFSARLFGGNQAGVVLPAHPLDDGVMQQIAAEFKHSETAFAAVEPDGSGVPVPVSVELTGPRSEVLSRWLETELGVPAERQVWNEN